MPLLLVRSPWACLATLSTLLLAQVVAGQAAADIAQEGLNNEGEDPKHFVVILQDDLGRFDVGFNGNENNVRACFRLWRW